MYIYPSLKLVKILFEYFLLLQMVSLLKYIRIYLFILSTSDCSTRYTDVLLYYYKLKKY